VQEEQRWELERIRKEEARGSGTGRIDKEGN